jgi:hypothetical protein
MQPVDSYGIDGPVSELGQLVATIATYAAALVVLALVVRLCLRRRTWTPLVVLLGGGFTCLLEPLFDHLYGLWFQTQGQWPMFTVYGVHLPIWLPGAYLAYYGGGAVLVAEMLRSGAWGAKEIRKFYAANVVLAVIAEVAYIELFGVYNYQDNQPWVLFGYPMFLAFCNSVSPVVAGVLAYKLTPKLAGWWRLSLFYVEPMCFATGAFGGGFLYLAYRHATDTPNTAVLWALSALAAATACLLVKMATLLLDEPSGGDDDPVQLQPAEHQAVRGG